MSPLHDILLQEAVAAGGALPLHRFMALCLHHPAHGYYTAPRSPIGKAGDFITAPELTSLFGELLTLHWIEVWEAMGQPDAFALLEVGPGTGVLARDILATSRRFPAFHQALRYLLLELSPAFIARQRETLAPLGLAGDKVRWIDAPEAFPGVGGILSNELFDALPVHGVAMTAAGWREIAVRPGADGWESTLMPLSPELAPDPLAGLGVTLPVGMRGEVGLAARGLMTRLAGALQQGMMLTIDYGYPAHEYYHPALRPQGTLVGHRGHQRVDDFLLFPGEMDLTAHVEFTALARAGEQAGLATLGFAPQGWFLMGLGILERLQQLAPRLDPAAMETLNQTVKRLIMPEAMGEKFKVLAQGRGLPATTWSGFRLQNQQARLSSCPS